MTVSGSLTGCPRRQEGISLLGMLVVIALITFIGVMIMRLFPVYLESYEVGSVLGSMENDAELRGADRTRLRQTLNRRFQVNGIQNVGRDDIRFTQERDGTRIVVEYEVRVPLIGNLDGVASFRREATIAQ